LRWNDKVTVVKGVGPKMAEKLARLDIKTVGDLVSFYPRRYQDWSHITPMDEVEIDKEAAVYGRVVDMREVHPRRFMTILNVLLTDGRGAVMLVYFNQPWKKEQFRKGSEILAYGRVEYQYGKYQIGNAEIEEVSEEDLPHFQKLVPVYPLTEGIRLSQMQRMVQFALNHLEGIEENLPLSIRESRHLMGRMEAIRCIHTPKNWAEQKAARHRLAYEELFFMQAGICLLRRKREEGHVGIKCAPSGKLVQDILSRLPFALTDGQKRAFADIESDMEGLVPMSRLVQGDVGSGKTAVAALALAKIVENGYQGALMVPTEVLAVQHFKGFSRLFEGTPVRLALLTGQVRGKEKEDILTRLKEGEIDIIIGTHALIEDNVQFAHLGLVITDEQHRFGVKQRAALETKGEEMPHTLVMTATPIPRTMALSVYGDLDVSIIRGLPPGRQPVGTYAIGRSLLPRVYRFMAKEMTAGHQVYVVCPLVEKSEKADLAAAKSVYENLQQNVFPKFHVGLVHGRMKGKEKEDVMNAFARGEIQLLVATSVIEVGVNVPNATIMFVYGADRFGLSQLHQLRGRVGRGKAKSYCILYTDNNSDITRIRMQLMEQIQDGFLLSEKDLLLRGSGEFFGVNQHGMDDLRAADIVRDLPILEEAREDAQQCVNKGMDFREELSHRFRGEFFRRIYH
jgi:ATP-dependent DNA helicase RecG